MSGDCSDQCKPIPGSVPLSISGAPAAAIELLPVYRGMRGPEGAKGDVGDPADIGEMPSLSLIFDNQLI